MGLSTVFVSSSPYFSGNIVLYCIGLIARTGQANRPVDVPAFLHLPLPTILKSQAANREKMRPVRSRNDRLKAGSDQENVMGPSRKLPRARLELKLTDGIPDILNRQVFE
ncbi:hypothetical protein OPV22_001325 [Ensete ventricosum]|uniref:Uncharacterized protein n=1 Tax=Ensete ventricosum TaxID=4639 RepID=A0AAV8QC00_ENSVE|nr:hypothetical protein OPV22_001325 [Ensete ventricosum]